MATKRRSGSIPETIPDRHINFKPHRLRQLYGIRQVHCTCLDVKPSSLHNPDKFFLAQWPNRVYWTLVQYTVFQPRSRRADDLERFDEATPFGLFSSRIDKLIKAKTTDGKR
jgi:hypothetical protein